ncbi:hypothetical protein [Paramagnetospirillum magneticum]|uniref:Uncharacterized protein n=1 Tax=Paramagnetospirillum magneticum (strain ATCC 700264 / AMB-1) TaxID=342108 RepID=Q2W7H7_PARM1|nr:hypothetical protein [Paramagnetospirillum magneticum]BAE50198.1 hypothetical protein amb1394 [Paramagnetospirillum magneticum AMB-1]
MAASAQRAERLSGTYVATPTHASATVTMIQDAIPSTDILVDSNSANPVGTFVNPVNSMVEGLVIAAQGSGTLCHAARSTASPTGWALNPITTSATPLEVVGGTAYAGQKYAAVYGFYSDGAALWSIALGADGVTWGSPVQVVAGGVSQLGTAYSPAGQLVVYGCTAAGDLLVAYQTTLNGAFTTTSCDVGGTLAGNSASLVMVDETGWNAVIVQNNVPSLYTGSLGDTGALNTGTFQSLPSGTLISEVSLGFWSSIQQDCIFLMTSQSGQVYTVAPGGQPATAVGASLPTGTSVRYAGGHATNVTDLGIVLDLYMVDSDLCLWVMHQSQTEPWDMNGNPVFSSPVPLGAGVAGVFGDLNPADGTSLFTIDDQEGALCLWLADAGTGNWVSNPVLTSGTEIYEVTRFKVQMAVSDQNYCPMPNQSLTLALSPGSSAADITIGGNSYFLGSQSPLTVTTDGQGNIVASILTTSSLFAPGLVLSCQGTTLATVQPASDIQAYLSGQGTLNPYNPGGALPVFDKDGTTLSKATIGNDNQPLAPNLKGNPALAKAAAQAIIGGAQAGQGTGTTAGFAVQFDPKTGQATFRHLHSHDEVRTERSDLAASPLCGSIWSDIGDWAGDIWQGIKNGVIIITSAVVDLAKQIATLVVKIGDEISAAFDMAIHGIEEAAQFIGGVFQWIGAEIETAISWLEALLDFGAIWRTKMAIQSCLVNGLGSCITGLGTMKSAADGWFDQEEATVKAYFTQLAGTLANQTMSSQTGGQSPGNAPSSTPQAGNLSAAGTTSNVQGSWLSDQVNSNGGVNTQTITPGDALQQALTDFTTAWNGACGDFDTAFQDFWQGLSSTLSDPQAFATLGLPAFVDGLGALIDGFLELAKGVVDVLFDLAIAAIAAVGDALTASMGDGFLGDLWAWMAGKAGYPDDADFNLVAVISLIIAFPGTVFYKLAYPDNGEPFPAGDPLPYAPSAPGAKGPGSVGFTIPTGWMEFVSICNIMAYIPRLVSDIAGPDNPELIEWTLCGLSFTDFLLHVINEDDLTWDDLIDEPDAWSWVLVKLPAAISRGVNALMKEDDPEGREGPGEDEGTGGYVAMRLIAGFCRAAELGANIYYLCNNSCSSAETAYRIIDPIPDILDMSNMPSVRDTTAGAIWVGVMTVINMFLNFFAPTLELKMEQEGQ